MKHIRKRVSFNKKLISKRQGSMLFGAIGKTKPRQKGNMFTDDTKKRRKRLHSSKGAKTFLYKWR